MESTPPSMSDQEKNVLAEYQKNVKPSRWKGLSGWKEAMWIKWGGGGISTKAVAQRLFQHFNNRELTGATLRWFSSEQIREFKTLIPIGQTQTEKVDDIFKGALNLAVRRGHSKSKQSTLVSFISDESRQKILKSASGQQGRPVGEVEKKKELKKQQGIQPHKVPSFDFKKFDELVNHAAWTTGFGDDESERADKEKLEEFIKANSSFFPPKDGPSPLHVAMLRFYSTGVSRPEFIKWLIEKDPSVIRAKDERGRTPLHVACFGPATDSVDRARMEKLVKVLIEYDSTLIYDTDKDGRIPLHLAMATSASYRWGPDLFPPPRITIANLLGREDEKVSRTKDKNGKSPEDLYKEYGALFTNDDSNYRNSNEFAQKHEEFNELLKFELPRLSSESVEEIQQPKEPMEVEKPEGTEEYESTEEFAEEIQQPKEPMSVEEIQQLKEKEEEKVASFDFKQFNKLLDKAASAEEEGIQKLEAFIKANPSFFPPKAGTSPLHWAMLHFCSTGHCSPKFITWLIQQDSTVVRAKDERGKTPLHIAGSLITSGRGDAMEEIVKVLVKHDKALIYERDNDRRTPLHLAMVGSAGYTQDASSFPQRRASIVKLLGMDDEQVFAARDKNEQTPQDLFNEYTKHFHNKNYSYLKSEECQKKQNDFNELLKFELPRLSSL